MKVISCVGYHDTGSGAVDDFLREFENIAQAKYGVEYRGLQDPDGVSDLEFNIVENPHRLNTGYAIKRFKKFVKASRHTYGLIFGDLWERESDNYINDLIKFEYNGYWSGDMMLMKPWQRGTYYIRRAFNKVLPRQLKKPSTWNYFPNEKTFHCNLTEQEFLNCTHRYVDALLHAINKENKEMVVLDQAVSAMNIGRYIRYFDTDIKVIVVDRDPRDVFIEEILLKGRVLPKDPSQFADVYRSSRRRVGSRYDESKALFINFEDLIYHYESTTKKIMEFIGLSEENRTRTKYFDPKVSIKNTRLWEKHPEFKKQVAVLERELPEFLYKNYLGD